MKKKQHLLKCGRVIYYNETTPKDIVYKKSTVDFLNKHRKELEQLFKYDHAGRGRVRWAKLVYDRFCTFLSDYLADSLINGDRIETFNGHKWMIAGDDNPNSRHSNWHTNGVKYGVVISGIKSKFGIRLSRKKRKELQSRIMSGQNYHTIHE